MIRRFGHLPSKNIKYCTRPGAYAILPRFGKLLLTSQLDPGPDLQLPGGGIEQGESPISALHREVYEETGWSISRPRKLGIFRRFVYMPEYNLHAEKICHIYVARPVQRIGPPVEQGHEPVWLSPDIAVHELGNPGDRHFVQRYQSRF